jgi:hypothetical protein
VSTAGISGLLVISMIAFAAPVLAGSVQRATVPDVVIEIGQTADRQKPQFTDPSKIGTSAMTCGY